MVLFFLLLQRSVPCGFLLLCPDNAPEARRTVSNLSLERRNPSLLHPSRDPSPLKRTLIRSDPRGKVEVMLPPFCFGAAFAAVRDREGGFSVVYVKWRVDRAVSSAVCGRRGTSFLGDLLPPSTRCMGRQKNFFRRGKKWAARYCWTSQLICIRVRSTAPETVHKRLFLWYKAQIQKRIEERLSEICPRIPWIDTVPHSVCARCGVAGELHEKRRDYSQYASHQSAPAVPRLRAASRLAHLQEHNTASGITPSLSGCCPTGRPSGGNSPARAPLIPGSGEGRLEPHIWESRSG